MDKQAHVLRTSRRENLHLCDDRVLAHYASQKKPSQHGLKREMRANCPFVLRRRLP